MRKTIIMLSAKRCGSTAVSKMFQKHPDVKICHQNQEIDLWESGFWNLGAGAIAGQPEAFVKQLKESLPFVKIPLEFTENSVFKIWDEILDHLGPTVFVKGPQYLGNEKACQLLLKYKQQGNDVRLFAFIRDPRDAIASQYELWRSHVNNDSPKKREASWLQKYQHLEELEKDFGFIPLFRYEDFARAPQCYVPLIFNHCDIKHLPETYDHIRPVSIGRYSASANWRIRIWRMSPEFKNHIKKYGYTIPQTSLLRNFIYLFKIFTNSLWREMKTMGKRILKFKK